MNKFFVGLFFLLAIFLSVPNGVMARIGVGVGTGKIQVDEKLKPGIIYNLPDLAVINTGDEASDYEVSVSFQQDQPQVMPEQSWFVFTPEKFYLQPGEVKNVSVRLDLPLKVNPGEYFAYLEAQPLKKVEKGKTSIGVAAAAKLYFTIVPANIFQGIYYKVISFFKVYAPWPERVLWVLLFAAAFVIAKKYLKINIGIKKESTSTSKQNKENE